MTVFAVGSTHGSPGATSTLMGLAAGWQETTGRDVLVVEADPDGGVLAARVDDLRADRTLADVAVDVRRGFDLDGVLASARTVWGAVPVVVAPPSAEQTQSALAAAAERLALGFAAAGVDVLVDVGRLTTRSPALPLARRAAVTALVARPSFQEVALLSPRVRELRAHGVEAELVFVGDRPYAPVEAATVADAPLLAVLPDDARAAAPLAGAGGGDRVLRRSLLWRALCELASRLAARVPAAADESEAAVLESVVAEVRIAAPRAGIEP